MLMSNENNGLREVTDAIERLFAPSVVHKSICLVFYVINQLPWCNPCTFSILKMAVTN